MLLGMSPAPSVWGVLWFNFLQKLPAKLTRTRAAHFSLAWPHSAGADEPDATLASLTASLANGSMRLPHSQQFLLPSVVRSAPLHII